MRSCRGDVGEAEPALASRIVFRRKARRAYVTFTSLTFLIFFATFFALYWLTYAERRLQNLLVLAASYVFYG